MSTGTELQDSPALAPTITLAGQRLIISWTAVPVVAVFAGLYVYLSYIPLFYTDIWGHVAYGKWMLEHHALPSADPFLPLSQGIQVVDSSWLSQLFLASADAWNGPEALCLVFALTTWLTYVVLCRAFYLLSGRVSLAMIGTALAFLINFGRHGIIRPEIFGGLCMAALTWMLVRGEPWRSRAAAFAGREADDAKQPWLLWIGVPLLMALWANLHGSFFLGIVVLGCHALGRGIEVTWTARNPLAVLQDRWFVRWTLLTELALAGSLLNPYGMDLLFETVAFGRNPNLKDILEWYNLKLVAAEGMQFAATVLLWLGLYRFSRQRVSVVDMILLLVFASGMAVAIRIVAWYAFMFSLCMMPHIVDIGVRLGDHWREKSKLLQSALSAPPKLAYTLICLLFAWVAFAMSPTGGQVLGSQPRPTDRVYASGTPLALTEYLRENPPPGLLYAPQWFCDWIAWAGPKGVKTVVSTNIHLAPKLLWDGYMEVSKGGAHWSDLLDRWNVQAVVVDKEKQETLLAEVRKSPTWEVVYEDPQGIIALRRNVARVDHDETKVGKTTPDVTTPSKTTASKPKAG